LIHVTFNNIFYENELLLKESKSGIIQVTVEGHALFNDRLEPKPEEKKGQNIICAAVSFSALTLLKSITMIAEIMPDYTLHDGLMDIKIDVRELDERKKAVLRVLLESFIIGMLDMNSKYPGYINMRTVAESM
jgi:uncharacterized protein YsxB (DUF464 family)